MSTSTSAVPVHGVISDHQLARYRSTLEEQWRRQVHDILELSYDALDDNNADRDDDGSWATDQLVSSRLLAAARQQLQDTEDALARVKNGTYGVCNDCAERVAPERLEILPAARFCVACQARRTAK